MERATDLTKSPASHGTFDAEMLDAYAQACGWVLARAHAKASELSATISGHLGSSNDAFDITMARFALAYAESRRAIQTKARQKSSASELLPYRTGQFP